MRIPALVTPDLTLTDSHSICDYINGELGGFRLLAREGASRWRALADIAVACGIIEAQIARRAELLRVPNAKGRRISSARCATGSSGASPTWRSGWGIFGAAFDLAQITIAVACSYDDWRYGDEWRSVAPKLAAWFDIAAKRPSMQATQPAETPQS